MLRRIKTEKGGSLRFSSGNYDAPFYIDLVFTRKLPKQMGAPVRLVVPWKYGFKSIKSIVRITFTDKRPVSFWEKLQPKEYGFWANVNPKVDHPRWSQARERTLSGQTIPTQLFNGYAQFVAHLYEDKNSENLFR